MEKGSFRMNGWGTDQFQGVSSAAGRGDTHARKKERRDSGALERVLPKPQGLRSWEKKRHH